MTLAFLPIFTANLVFAQRFKSTSASATAFGANLLGAMFGGLLEYASLIIGYRTLLVVVALLYGLAFLTGRKELAVTAGDGGGEGESLGRSARPRALVASAPTDADDDDDDVSRGRPLRRPFPRRERRGGSHSHSIVPGAWT